MLLTELAAEASLAEIFARTRFGMAIAAMIKIMATTISNSIRENPLCLVSFIFAGPVTVLDCSLLANPGL